MGNMHRKQKIRKHCDKNVILPIVHKKESEHYRPICLGQTSLGIYIRVLETRLREYVEHRLEGDQAAFRPSRQTSDIN